jgi:leucyl aminopeptidase
LIVVRAGDGSPESIRKAVFAATAHLKGSSVQEATVYAGALLNTAGVARAAVVAAAEATYTYTTTLSKFKARAIKTLTLVGEITPNIEQEMAEGKALVAGIEWAKEWANRPGNHATPSDLAHAAESLEKEKHVKVEVLGPKEVAKLGMGAFMAVAQGSAEPLRFIVIRYEGGTKSQAPVVLVGKGITFDTGGISIKPAPEMDEMKFDMGGAASVLGTMRAIAELQPKLNVVALIPTCENMPDGQAVKPGDVVTALNGTTIEILNTDAEGRLILCDALAYAERFKPRAVIDIATLTGACVIALGHVRSGLFSADDELASALAQAGDAAQDPCWRMPLDDVYAEGLKTNFADVANVAGRAGGSITAAKFLQKFVGNMPWAHLDIAGTAWKSGAAKGATGRPVSLLVQYLLTLAAQDKSVAKKKKTAAKASDA